jgi:hypothetical protein
MLCVALDRWILIHLNVVKAEMYPPPGLSLSWSLVNYTAYHNFVQLERCFDRKSAFNPGPVTTGL